LKISHLLPALAVFALLPVKHADAWKQKDFVLSFWWPPPPAETTTERYKQIADAGFNWVLGGNGVSNPGPSKAMLEAARKNKLKALVLDDRVYGGKPGGVDAVVKEYGDSPALEGFLVKDEPNTSEFPALRDTVAALKKADGNRLAFINLLPTYASVAQLGAPTYEEYVKQYLDVVKPEVLCFDHYPFTSSGERADYLENLEIIRRQALSARIPFWLFIQSEGIEGAYRSPTETELRIQVFTALAYGARGILYFTYWTPESGGGEKHFDGILTREGKTRAHYEWVKRLHEEIRPTLALMMNLKSRDVYQVGKPPQGTRAVPDDDIFEKVEGDPATLGTFDGPGGRRFIWVVNRSASRSAKVTLDFYANRVARMFEHAMDGKIGPNLLRTDLKFKPTYDVLLGPGEGKLYEIPEILR
jgi:hypothetical protein